MNHNTWEGIRVDDNWMRTTLEFNRIHENDFKGIWFDYSGLSRFSFIDRNHVWLNGDDGMWVSKGWVGYAGIYICGNTVHDNHQIVNNDWQTSEIRIKGHIGQHGITPNGDIAAEGNGIPTRICNNIIYNGGNNHALGIIRLEVGDPPIEVYAGGGISIENNIMYNCSNGIYLQFSPDDNGALRPAAINNTIHDMNVFGIMIVPPLANPVSLFGESIQNNIFSNCNTGISDQFQDGQNLPVFLFNGFFQNANADIVNAGEANSVFADPVFVNVDAGEEDLHLQWNSAMINRGNGAGQFNDPLYPANGINRDGSFNDVGAYGGPRAADYGYDPYCAVASGANLTNANLPANRDWLEDDYYRVFGSVSTPNGQTFDIGDPNVVTGAAYFEFAGNYRWLVQGTIHASGNDGADEPRNIYFRTLEGVDRWMRLEVNVPDNDCWLRGCDMEGGGYNVYAYGGAVENVPDLFIGNCLFAGSEYQNVLVSGDIPVHFTDSEFTRAQYDGLTITNNGILSTIENCLFSGNGSAATYYAGLRINSSFPSTISGNTIGLNPSRGVYFFSCSPDMNGGEVGANIIYNNGPDQGQAGSTGAELYLTSTSDPTVDFTNIWDADGAGNRRGVFVYKSSGVAQMFTMCYWGGPDIWDGEIALFDGLQNKADYFHNATVPDEDPEDEDAITSNEFVEGGAPIPLNIDSEEDFLLALRFMETGEYYRAIPYLHSHLEDRSGIYDFNSLQRLLICVRSCSGDLQELRLFYLDYAGDEQTEYPLAFEAQRLAGMALLYDGYPEQAIEALRNLGSDTPSPSDSIAVEMDIAWAELVRRGGDEIDALSNYDVRINDLSRLYEESLESGFNGKALLPSQLTLGSAWPNPFNNTTKLSFSMPASAKVTLLVIDTQGRIIETLLSKNLSAGRHNIIWNAEGVAAGLYFCKLATDGQLVTTKMLLIK